MQKNHLSSSRKVALQNVEFPIFLKRELVIRVCGVKKVQPKIEHVSAGMLLYKLRLQACLPRTRYICNTKQMISTNQKNIVKSLKRPEITVLHHP